MSGTVTEDSEIPNQFPIGMKVLVVDHDQTCLFLRELLSLRQYQVTLADNSKTALELVKDKKNKFDLIIIEKEMPDMDGFNLLQLITLETNIPVILMSSNTNPELMEKAMRHKAYFVLTKPITIEMFNNTCLYVMSKHRVENQSSMNCSEKRDISENSVVSISSRSKREVDDSKNQKKSRVFWTNKLHNKFIEAVEKLEANGGKAVPKKILELMNIENLSRENVASHLQKHRLNLQKQPAKIGIAARNNDSFHSIPTKTIDTKTRPKPAKRPRIHLSQMSYNSFHPQPNPLHQSGQLINNIRPIPASGMFLQKPNEFRKYQQVPSYANGNILQELRSPRDNFDHLHYNNNNSLPMAVPNNSFLAGHQQQSGFSNQISGFNVPNNHFEVPLETNLDVNQTGLYRNMEFGEMNRRRDDLVSGNESYLIGKENELPSGFMDLEDIVNSYRNNK